MDVIDKRYKGQDRRFQEQDQRFEPREQLFQRRDEKSVEIEEDFGRNCETGGLSDQQTRPQGEDAYSEESGESEDDSTADGGKVLPRLENGKIARFGSTNMHKTAGIQSCNDFQACRE